jgi:2-aminoethylphosphonate-pyruvate transaminase
LAVEQNDKDGTVLVKIAAFMAAGIGSRLRGSLKSKPKGFLDIGDGPIIERSVRVLLESGIRKILFGTGYKSGFYEELERRYTEVTCVKNSGYEETGSFYTLYNMREHITEDFLLLESDLLYEKHAVSFLQEDCAENIVLASGWTHSGDEFYIEVDEHFLLMHMSKNRDELHSVYGELVGISKISYGAFGALCRWAEAHMELARKKDYEFALNSIARDVPIVINKIDDLLWVEIDDESHLQRARSNIYPKIKEKEHEHAG